MLAPPPLYISEIKHIVDIEGQLRSAVLDRTAAAAQYLRKAARGGSSGGGGGFLGSLLKLGAGALGGGGSGVTVDTSTFAGADFSAFSTPMFANGTTGAPGGWAIVGEDGPELLPLRPGQPVIPNHRLPQMLAPRPGNDNTKAAGGLHIHFHHPVSEAQARRTGSQAASAYNQKIAQARRAGIAG